LSALDLAARLRIVQRALRSRLERRDALLDIVRAVNGTLDPEKIAELVVDRARAWLPARSASAAACSTKPTRAPTRPR